MKVEVLQKMLGELLLKGGFSFEKITLTTKEGGATLLHIKSSKEGELIGNEGDVLKAFQHLLRRIVEKGESESPLILDVNEYRANKEQALKEMVMLKGEGVVLSQGELELPPMDSFERRLVHHFFEGHKEIKTLSRGEGKERRVVLVYSKTS